MTSNFFIHLLWIAYVHEILHMTKQVSHSNKFLFLLYCHIGRGTISVVNVHLLSYGNVFQLIFLYKSNKCVTHFKYLFIICQNNARNANRKILMRWFETKHMTKRFIWQTLNASWNMILKIGALGQHLNISTFHFLHWEQSKPKVQFSYYVF